MPPLFNGRHTKQNKKKKDRSFVTCVWPSVSSSPFGARSTGQAAHGSRWRVSSGVWKKAKPNITTNARAITDPTGGRGMKPPPSHLFFILRVLQKWWTDARHPRSTAGHITPLWVIYGPHILLAGPSSCYVATCFASFWWRWLASFSRTAQWHIYTGTLYRRVMCTQESDEDLSGYVESSMQDPFLLHGPLRSIQGPSLGHHIDATWRRPVAM